MSASVIVATYKRSAELRACLAALSRIEMTGPWEVVVVDNNSTDDTPRVVEAATRDFPTTLQYVFEAEQGRCAALNAGIRIAKGKVLAFIDDDVTVTPPWLKTAVQAFDELDCHYMGGRVRPRWDVPPPRWVLELSPRLHGVLAILDYGDTPVEFGARFVPLGCNFAARSDAFLQAGLFDPRIGRRAGTLLGQEIREWCVRARAAGLKGLYVPDMIVEHLIPRERLSRRYFRRWFYWHGVSRALLYSHHGLNLESPEDVSLPLARVPHIAGVPRYLFRTCLSAATHMVLDQCRRRSARAFEHELWLWFFLGIVVQRWKRRPAG